jgi:hypothetical protein
MRRQALGAPDQLVERQPRARAPQPARGRPRQASPGCAGRACCAEQQARDAVVCVDALTRDEDDGQLLAQPISQLLQQLIACGCRNSAHGRECIDLEAEREFWERRLRTCGKWPYIWKVAVYIRTNRPIDDQRSVQVEDQAVASTRPYSGGNSSILGIAAVRRGHQWRGHDRSDRGPDS